MSWYSLLCNRDAIAGAAVNIAMYPPIPSSLILGGSACIGAKKHCIDKTDKRYIDGGAYVSVDVYVPEKNFFLAYTTGFTIEHALNIAVDLFQEVIDECDAVNNQVVDSVLPCNGLQVLHDGLSSGIDLIPHEVLVTGIMPLYPDKEGCNDTSNNVGANVKLDCYAYLSVSPLTDNRIEATGLDIERGIKFAGRLNLFDKFEAIGEGKVCDVEGYCAVLQSCFDVSPIFIFTYSSSINTTDRCFCRDSKLLFGSLHQDKRPVRR